MERLEAIVKSKGMKVFARLNQQDAAIAVGLEMRPTELLIFGDPRAGTILMNKCPLPGNDLPLKAPVWEGENGHR